MFIHRRSDERGVGAIDRRRSVGKSGINKYRTIRNLYAVRAQNGFMLKCGVS